MLKFVFTYCGEGRGSLWAPGTQIEYACAMNACEALVASHNGKLVVGRDYGAIARENRAGIGARRAAGGAI